ncbi:MAG: hypothetical protein FJ027_06755 [Candidatus Rokubacteria bacterium]|nr:hypothetical protein [Candidatus Rokubacteria bacterium]
MKRLWLIPFGGLVIVLALSAAVWLAVPRGEALVAYYPFEPVGRTWEYVVTDGAIGRKGSAVFVARGAGTFADKPTLVIAVEREMPGDADAGGSKVGVLNHFTVTDAAVHQLALEWANVRDPRQGGKVIYNPPVAIAKLPLRAGATWETSTQIHSPRDDGDFRASSKRYVHVMGREAVEVPAGRFDTLRVEIRTISLREGRTEPTESVRTEWRVRGIGLVKLTEGPFELALKSHAEK